MREFWLLAIRDLFEALSDDLGAGLHDLGIVMLNRIKVQLEHGALVEQTRDGERAQILQQVLATQGESLRVQRVEVFLVDFVADRADILSQIRS